MKTTQAIRGLKTEPHRLKLNEVFGNDELSAWRVGDGEFRIQTRDARHRDAIARLNRRTARPAAREVASGCSGGYLRVYELEIPAESVVSFIRERLTDRPPSMKKTKAGNNDVLR